MSRDFRKGSIMKNNKDIRAEIEKARVKLWEIADKLGINDSSLSRKLRKELSPDEKERIRKIISELTGGGKNG
jgi:hypothetical protein